MAQYLSVNIGTSAIVNSLGETNGRLVRPEGDVAFQAASPASAYVTTRRLNVGFFFYLLPNEGGIFYDRFHFVNAVKFLCLFSRVFNSVIFTFPSNFFPPFEI